MTCNLTKYEDWLSTRAAAKYLDIQLLQALVNIDRSSKAWKVLDFDTTRSKFIQGRLILSNEMIMDASFHLCSEHLGRPQNVGGHGPISTQQKHDLMCSPLCMINDELRTEALSISNCSCLYLSTQEDHPLYKRRGDWCERNSGHLLCSKLNHCGEWKCDIQDFMCKRIEYDYNHGKCSSAYSKPPKKVVIILIGLVLLWI